MVCVILLVGARQAFSQLLDVESRKDACSRAQAILDQRESAYVELIRSLDISRECPTMSLEPALELQSYVQGELSEMGEAAQTELGARLPFAVVNAHNNLLTLTYLDFKYRRAGPYAELMDYYTTELLRNVDTAESLCPGLVIPRSLAAALRRLADPAGPRRNRRPAPGEERYLKCMRDCETYWRTVLDPRWNLAYLTEVVNCQARCRK
ncbi:MAG: hypothetical protein AB1646_01325 [Thermodesulfobacteriota bacterium]